MKEEDFQTGKYDKATKESERFSGKFNVVFFAVLLCLQLYFYFDGGDWVNLVTIVVATIAIGFYIYHIRRNRE